MPTLSHPRLVAVAFAFGVPTALLGCEHALSSPGEDPAAAAAPAEPEPRFDAPGTAGEDTDPLEDIRAELDAHWIALAPTADVASSGVRPVGDAQAYFRNLDDGTSFAQADGFTTFVRT